MLVEAHSMSMAFFTCHIAHFCPFVRIKKDAYLCNVPNFPTSQKFFEKNIKKMAFLDGYLSEGVLQRDTSLTPSPEP